MQLFGLDWPINSVNELLSNKKEIIKKANKNEPEAIALLCLINCFECDEEKALELLPKIINKDKKKCLGQIIVNHFYCYILIAEKFSINKEKLQHLYKKSLEYSGLTPDPSLGITIGASLIVKNEENFLENCLKSLQGIVDEIVVMDTGSTDKTLEIAKKYNAKIGHFEWCDDFAAARNAALALNTTHWIMLIDADETLEKEGFLALLEGISRPQNGAYMIKIINYLDEDDKTNTLTHHAVRIFQRIPGACFRGKIHEQVSDSLIEKGYQLSAIKDVIQYHYGYTKKLMEEKDKSGRAIKSVKEELKKDPKNPIQWFNLANAYFCATDWKECIKASEKTASLLQCVTDFAGLLYHNWAVAYLGLNNPKKALIVCNEFDKKKQGSIPIINYVKALTYLRLDEKEKALKFICLCIEGKEDSSLHQYENIAHYRAPFLKAEILYFLQRFEESIETLTKILNRNSNFYDALFLRGVAYININQFSKGLENFLKLQDNPLYKDRIFPLIAHCYFSLNQHKKGINALKNSSKELCISEDLLMNWLAHAEENDLLDVQYRFNQLSHPSLNLQLNYGRTLLRFGLNDLAEDQFKKMTLEDASNFTAWFFLGDIYLGSKNYLEAKNCYERGLALQKDNMEGWLNLGNCYCFMNNVLKAIDCYEEVLVRCPDHQAALNNLKIICNDLKVS